MHMVRNALAATSFTLLSLLAAGSAQAAPHATIVIQTGQAGPVYTQNRPVYLPAPPPPRREARPHARRGHVWVTGHWEWQGRRHVWKQGHWVQARRGHHYRQPQWVQHNGRWEMQGGRWDRDGDGVRNRYDRRPNNPYRY